jgi:hypothetical protein
MVKQKDCKLRYLLSKFRTTWGEASDRLRQRANKRNKTVSDVFRHRSRTGKSYCRTRSDLGSERFEYILFKYSGKRAIKLYFLVLYYVLYCDMFLVLYIWYSLIRASQYESVEITNNMQPCNRVYYSKLYWRLNIFRAAYRSSSGAPNCICSLWFIYTCGDRPLSRMDNSPSPHAYVNQRLQIQFGAPEDERYAARKMLSVQ